MYQQKADCENVVLSAADKELLRKIRKCPHCKCDPKEIENLRFFGLIREDPSGEVDAFYEPIGAGTYSVSDFYLVYEEYLKDKRRDIMLSSLWLPILVSFITTTAINLLGGLLPQIIR